MITLTRTNAKERCRTCLRKLIKNEVTTVVDPESNGQNFVHISSDQELNELLEKYVGIEDDEETNQDKDYPQNCCIDCFKELQSFESFRLRALDSASKLYKVFRGGKAEVQKIELDENGLETKDIIREQLQMGQENDNDIFNMLLKDSLMETEAILLDGVETENDANNHDPDPFRSETGEKQIRCRRGKKKDAVNRNATTTDKKSKNNKLNSQVNKSNRKGKKVNESNEEISAYKNVQTKSEPDPSEDFDDSMIKEDKDIEEEYATDDDDDWPRADFHMDYDESTDNEVLSKKVSHSRKTKQTKSKKRNSTDYNDTDSDSDFMLSNLKKDAGNTNGEEKNDDFKEFKYEQESDNAFSESDFDVPVEKQKSKVTNRKRSATSGRKKGLRNSYKCDQCNRRFGHKITLDAHVRKVHQGEKRAYKCELCDKSYSFMGGLTTHLREIHEREEQLYKCQIPGCEKQYSSYITLQRHIRIKHLMNETPTRYVCEQCGATFKQTSNLRYHMRTRHPTEEDLKHKEIIKERLDCEICNKSFNNLYTLKYHKLRIHADDKKYECKICGRRVAKKFMLDQHMLVHSEDKTACKFCGREFVRKYQVEAHIKAVHQKLKPFQCPHCSESFASRKTLRHHIYIHTGEKPYVCDVCGQAYRQPTCLKNHRKIHNKVGGHNTDVASAAALMVNRSFLSNLMHSNDDAIQQENNSLGLH